MKSLSEGKMEVNQSASEAIWKNKVYHQKKSQVPSIRSVLLRRKP